PRRGITARAARAEIHRRNELKPSREYRSAADARDRDDTVLERLPERLEHRSRELGELVEKENTAMGEARFSRSRRRGSAADDRRRGARMVRRTKGRNADQSGARPEDPGDRVDARDLERLVVAEQREDAGQAAREHRLAGS